MAFGHGRGVRPRQESFCWVRSVLGRGDGKTNVAGSAAGVTQGTIRGTGVLV